MVSDSITLYTVFSPECVALHSLAHSQIGAQGISTQRATTHGQSCSTNNNNQYNYITRARKLLLFTFCDTLIDLQEQFMGPFQMNSLQVNRCAVANFVTNPDLVYRGSSIFLLL